MNPRAHLWEAVGYAALSVGGVCVALARWAQSRRDGCLSPDEAVWVWSQEGDDG